MSRRTSQSVATTSGTAMPAFSMLECLEARCMLTGSPYVDRGWVSLIVDHTIAAELAPKIEQFKRDLVGDGWIVAPDSSEPNVLGHFEAPRMDDENYVWNNEEREPVTLAFDATTHHLDQYKLDLQAVKDIVKVDAAAAIAAGSYLSQIVLVGHPTVPYSGAPLGDYNQHAYSAATSDSYYADFDGTPMSWADYENFPTTYYDIEYEVTWNEAGDGRFDASFVPNDAIQFTVTGSSGYWQFEYSDVNREDEKDTHEFHSDTLSGSASADSVREALNDMLSPLECAFATVVKDGNIYTIRLLDSDGSTLAYEQSLTASWGGGLSVDSDLLATAGVECAIGRIDMANLDSAFPLVDGEEPLSNDEIERVLLNRYFDKDHAWRMGEVEASKALIDETTENGFGPFANSFAFFYQLHVGSNNVVRNAGTWLSEFSEEDPENYLFGALLHPGYFDGITGIIPDHGNDPPAITSYHFNETPAQAVFMASASSWSRDWNNRSFRKAYDSVEQDYYDGNGNVLFHTVPEHPQKSPLQRAILAADGVSLVSTWWRASYGEGTVGMFDSEKPLRLGYSAGEGLMARMYSTYDALMGDPTVRAAYPKPVSSVTATIDLATGDITINWNESPDDDDSDFVGYKVYRAASLFGEFEELGSTQPGDTDFVDDDPPGQFVYMVRAIKTENDGSANEYENASTGVFASQIIFRGSSVADDVYLKRFSGTSEDSIRVWANVSRAGEPNFKLDARTTESIEFDGNAGDDLFDLDYDAGSPVPSDGIAFDGGDDTDTLAIRGTSGPDTATFAVGSAAITGSAEITETGIEAVEFDGRLGNDDVTITGGPEVSFPSTQEFASLTIAVGASAQMAPGGANVLVTGELDLSETGSARGTLNLNDNAMVVDYTSSSALSDIQSLITKAYDTSVTSGHWQASGITSSFADDSQFAIGYAEASALGAVPAIFGSVASTAVLVRYTFYADANLNGTVNLQDFNALAANFGGTDKVWSQGDFNYDGNVNLNDFNLLAANFGLSLGGGGGGQSMMSGGGGGEGEGEGGDDLHGEDEYYTYEELWEMLMNWGN